MATKSSLKLALICIMGSRVKQARCMNVLDIFRVLVNPKIDARTFFNLFSFSFSSNIFVPYGKFDINPL